MRIADEKLRKALNEKKRLEKLMKDEIASRKAAKIAKEKENSRLFKEE